MMDLSKIDFAKCKLPKWQDVATRAVFVNHSVHIRDGRESHLERYGTLVCRNANGDWWTTAQCPGSTFGQLDELKAICAQIDAFIAAEQKRIEDESLPPWRECTREEALANPECSEWNMVQNPGEIPCESDWDRIETYRGDVHPRHYVFHTRAPKPDPKLPKVRAPEGWTWQKRKLPGKFELVRTDGVGVDVPPDKSWRDAMLACVAAYDLEHGEAPLVWVSQWQRELSVWDRRSVLRTELFADLSPGNCDENAHRFIRAAESASKFVLVEVEP